eukprot:788402-Pleurochrysis_carterae.AAC.1
MQSMRPCAPIDANLVTGTAAPIAAARTAEARTVDSCDGRASRDACRALPACVVGWPSGDA